MLDLAGSLRKNSLRAGLQQLRRAGRIAQTAQILEARPCQKGQGKGRG